VQQLIGLFREQHLQRAVRVVERRDPELFQQMDQRVNKATRQLQMQLQHLTHLLGALVKTKRKMPVRFEISHQLPGHSNELRAIVRVWGGVKVPRNS
jgi:hypothetical protein